MMARHAVPGAIAALLIMVTAVPAGAAAVMMEVRAGGHPIGALVPGARISVTVRKLPAGSPHYCLGLASTIDRHGLPVSLGRFTRDTHGNGQLDAVIPRRLFPAEPPGPFLLFVGTCTSIAPDRPFLARTIVDIVPPKPLHR